MKKIFKAFGIFLVLILLFGCSMDVWGVKKCHKLVLSKSNISTDLDNNEVFTITARTYQQDGKERNNTNIVWTFVPPESIEVINSTSDSISFRVLKAGDIVLTAYDESNSGIKQSVIISATPGAVEDVTLSKTTLTLNQKEETSLKANLYPEGSKLKYAVWESSDTTVVDILSKPSETEVVIKAGIPGTATITLKVTSDDNTEKKATCKVTVSEMEIPETSPRYITLSKSFVSLSPNGSSLDITAQAYDAYNMEYTGGTYSWNSSNPDVADIVENGNVVTIIPYKEGDCEITVRLEDYPEYNPDNVLSATCKVIVGNDLVDILISPYTPPVKTRSLFSEEDPQSINSIPIGGTLWFKASYLPAETTETGVVWRASNNNISIEPDGEIVKVIALKEGSADLIAQSTVNTEIESYVSFTVYDPYVEPDNSISRIVLNPSSLTLEEGSSEKITASVVFADGRTGTTPISWAVNSSAVECEQLNSDGSELLVSAMNYQDDPIIITATALANPYVKSNAYVMVFKKGTEPGNDIKMIVPSSSSVVIAKGASIDIPISFLPPGTTQTEITLETSSDVISATTRPEAINIQGNNEGSADIKIISSNNPMIFARINVRVVSEESIYKEPSYVEVFPTVKELEVNDTAEISAIVHYTDGSEGIEKFSWEISSAAVDIVDNQQNKTITIKGIKTGSADVTVKLASNPSIKAVCKALVYEEGTLPEASLIQIVPGASSLVMEQGATRYVPITYLPMNFNPSGLTWSQEGTSVEIEGDTNGVLIKAVSAGLTTISAISVDNPSVRTNIRVNVLSESEAQTPRPSFITLSSRSYNVEVGDSGSIEAVTYLTDGTISDVPLVWSVEGNSISLSDENNKATFTAMAEGSATIQVKVSTDPNVYSTAKVEVHEKGSLPKPELSQIVPSTNYVSMIVGTSTNVNISYLPLTTDQRELLWKVTDSSIVSVEGESDMVKITALSAGTTTITATSVDKPSISTSIQIRVINEEDIHPAISHIKLSKQALELEVGTTDSVTGTVYLIDGSVGDNEIKWETDRTDVIDLRPYSDEVEVIAKKAGIATITAVVSDNPDAIANIIVWVYEEGLNPGSELVMLNPSSSSFSIVEGNSAEVTIQYLPEDTIDRGLSWSVSGSSVDVSETEDGAIIKALKSGNSVITVTSSVKPTISTSINVTVVTQEQAASLVRQIILTPDSFDIKPPYPSGESLTLSAESIDSSGNTVIDSYIWTIDDSSVVSGRVDPSNASSYLLTVKSPGLAKIKVQSRNNVDVSAICTISVEGGIKSISLSPSIAVLSEGGTAELVAELFPEDTIETDLTWTTTGGISLSKNNNNPNAVVVRGVSAGKATVKVQSTKFPLINAIANITVTDDTISVDTLPQEVVLDQDTIRISPPLTTPAILNAEVYGIDGMIYPIGVEWEIENPDIADITTQDDNRVSIVAKKAGETRIIASSIVDKSIQDVCLLTVSGRITGITPSESYLQIVKGETTTLSVALSPSNTIETDLVWFEEGFDPDVPATEDATALVSLRPTSGTGVNGCTITGLEIGQTRIIVRSKVRPEVQAIVAVDVIEKPLLKATITLSPSAIELGPDSSRTLVKAKVSVEGNDVVNEDVSFSVDPTGLVTTTPGGSNEIYISPAGISGEGTIYASLPSYPYIEAAKARIFVGGELRALSASTSQSLAVNVGDTIEIGVKYNPSNTTQTGISWTSSNPAVARVNGGSAPDAIVTGISSGTATITATSVYNSSIKLEFTIVVKSIINEISFTDQNGNKGLSFYTNTTDPLILNCHISPETAAQRKLIYKAAVPNFSMATITPINDTINDILFTPDPAAAGVHLFDIADSITGKIVATLEINTLFEGLNINTSRHVFNKIGETLQLAVTSSSGDVDPSQITFESSDKNVATVDRNGIVRAVKPGEAVISARIGEGGAVLKTQVYVNIDIPETLEQALRICSYLPAEGDTVLPSHLQNITTLDLRDTPKSIALDLSKIGTDIFPSLETLIIDGVALANKRLSLSGTKLIELHASDCDIESFTGIPQTLEKVVAKNNLITGYSTLGNSDNLKELDLEGNRITSYQDIPTLEVVNISNNQLKRIDVNSTRLKVLDASDNDIASVEISSDTLVSLDLSNNALRYNNFNIEDGTNLAGVKQSIHAQNLEILNLADNLIGLSSKVSESDGIKPYALNTGQKWRHTTDGWVGHYGIKDGVDPMYNETEKSNINAQPLQEVIISGFPQLREIDLRGNHIRSGLNAADKKFLFAIESDNLQKVYLEGNNIGNYYRFENSSGAITSVSSTGATNQYGMTISYDHLGCFYTNHKHYYQWSIFQPYKNFCQVNISYAYMY